MLSFSWEQNTDFVIFGIAPTRMAEVTKLIGKLPHKYVIGCWKGQVEASCLMRLKDFLPQADELGKGEKCYLLLNSFNPNEGARPASIVPFKANKTNKGKSVHIGNFLQVTEPPRNGDFIFDPQTGNFYAVVVF